MYQGVILLLIILGIVIIAFGLYKNSEKENTKIVYRYIPRTLYEEEESPAYASDVFRVMFDQPSPWIRSIDNMILRKREDINQFYINQF